jgi:type I restriction-modification system DNA methylase subunit
MWNKIVELMSDHSYMGEIARDEHRVKVTAEVFTPTDLVVRLLSDADITIFGPKQTILDPACGDGQFLCAIKHLKKIHFGMSEEEALADLYGIDIMRDNVDLCRKRLGGGNIYMGNTLKPADRLIGQSDFEHSKMLELFL